MKNGGSAFPVAGDSLDDGYVEGMTLRDWFAGQALAGLMAMQSSSVDPSSTAKRCFTLADAMLAERER